MSSSDGPQSAAARLRGRWLLLARSVWLGAAGLILCIFGASLLARFRAFDTLYRSSLPAGWSEAAMRAALAKAGLSTEFYMRMRVLAFLVVLPIVLPLFLPGSVFDPLTWSELAQSAVGSHYHCI